MFLYTKFNTSLINKIINGYDVDIYFNKYFTLLNTGYRIRFHKKLCTDIYLHENVSKFDPKSQGNISQSPPCLHIK